MRFLLLLSFAVASVQAQTADSVAYFNPARAFLWPQPFAHVPQTFEAQAVRFTAPFPSNASYLEGARLDALDLYVDVTSRSADNFNDQLRVSFLAPDPDGRPDPANPLGEAFELEFAELIPGRFNRLDLDGVTNVLMQQGQPDVWVVFELVPVGTPDTLALISGPKTNPPQFRAAARVAGEGWKLLSETQFAAEYNFHVAARFTRFIQSSVAADAFAPLSITALAPQPARDAVVVSFRTTGPDAVTLTLFDVLGRAVQREAVVGADRQVRLDVGGLPAGVYLLQLQAGQHRMARPVVVAR